MKTVCNGLLLLTAALFAACGRSSAPTRQAVSTPSLAQTNPGLTLPAGFRAELYAQGLRDPTSMAFGPDGQLYVTQTNGGENAGAGQVVVIGRPNMAPAVVLDRLFKPTGLIWKGRDLYIAAGRDVLRSTLDLNGHLSKAAPVVHNLPFNGRSEGQIDLLPDGRLLFEASGTIGDERSGLLLTWSGPGSEPEALARGLKNAYAHALDPTTGAIFTTDIGEENVDGKEPPEEIDLVQPGADYGWPRCYAERLPARDRDGTVSACRKTMPSLLTFPGATTPTGLTFYSGNDFPASYRNALYVALWNGRPPQVLRVTLSRSNGRLACRSTPFVDGLKRPIDVLPDPTGGLLVLDHQAGALYRVLAR